ncbi:MAG: MBL fold metallo-hydrolase [Chloroflexota bacterium]
MVKLIFLGTAAAVADKNHQNTHLALVGEQGLLLIDCEGSPILRLDEMGINLPQRMTDLLLTHFHPDHVAGMPSLVMSCWLMGRRHPLHVHGLDYTLERAEKLMALFEMDDWPNFYPLVYHPTPQAELCPVIDRPEFKVYGSPVCHLLPTMGLRIELPGSGKVIAYSCDTAPCDPVVRLARDADVLVHEATGAGNGHSSAAQAGQVAARAGARALYLIHYHSTGAADDEQLVAQARSTFDGPVHLAVDCMELTF